MAMKFSGSDNSGAPELEGYLFKRVASKNGLQTSWSRRWFRIQNGTLSQCYVTTLLCAPNPVASQTLPYNSSKPTGPTNSATLPLPTSSKENVNSSAIKKSKNNLVATLPINILLCEVRNDPSVERRHCFELISSQRSYLLQAESEADMNTWIGTIDLAKQCAVKESNVAESQLVGVGRMPIFDLDSACFEEDDDGERFYRVANVSQSLIQLDFAQQELSIKGSGAMPDANSVAANSSVIPDVSADAADDGSEAADSIQYLDSSWKRRNDELHSFLKSVPESDSVLLVSNCALKRDILIQGRLYLTQNRVCFYSSIMGFTTVLVIQLANVTQMQGRRMPLHYNIVFYLADGNQHMLKLFIKGANKTYMAIKTTWLNVSDPNVKASGKKRTPQELFDIINNVNAGASAGSNMIGSGMADEERDDDAVVPELRPVGADSAAVAEAAVESEYPSDFVEPTAPVPPSITLSSCPMFEKEDANIVINLSAKKVASLLMDENVDFWMRYHQERNDKDVHFEPFTTNDAGEKQRQARYIVPVSNPMVKVKETECSEVQTILKAEDGISYVLETRQSTPALPYGDAFQPLCQFSITWNTRTSCRVIAFAGIKWFKSPLVKSIIKSATLKGLAESNASIIAHLQRLAAASSVSGSAAGKSKADEDLPAVEDAQLHAQESPKPASSAAPVEEIPKLGFLSSRHFFAVALSLLLLSIVSLLLSIWLNKQNVGLLEHGISSLTMLASVGFQCSLVSANLLNSNHTYSLAAHHSGTGLGEFCQKILQDGYVRWSDFVRVAVDPSHKITSSYWDDVDTVANCDSNLCEAQTVLRLVEEFFNAHFEETNFRHLLGARHTANTSRVHRWNDTLSFQYPPNLESTLQRLSSHLDRNASVTDLPHRGRWNYTVPFDLLNPQLVSVYLDIDFVSNLTKQEHGFSRMIEAFVQAFGHPNAEGGANVLAGATHLQKFTQLAAAHQNIKTLRRDSIKIITDLEQKEKQLVHLLLMNWVVSLSARCKEAASKFASQTTNGQELKDDFNLWAESLDGIDSNLKRLCPLLVRTVSRLEQTWSMNL